MSKTRFTFVVPVKVPVGTTPKAAKRLLKRVIRAGLEDAANAPDDFNDRDVEKIKRIRVGKPTDPKPVGYAIVQEADGAVSGAVRTRRTLQDAIELALEIATEQTDADPAKLRSDLETDRHVSDPDGGWAVYVTGLEP